MVPEPVEGIVEGLVEGLVEGPVVSTGSTTVTESYGLQFRRQIVIFDKITLKTNEN